MRIARLVGAIGVALVAVNCFSNVTIRSGLPECPVGGVWSDKLRQLYGGAGVIDLSASQTDIPEYNDCQRFLVRQNGALIFDSLFAVFARANLDSVKPDTLNTGPAEPGMNMATILSYKRKYEALGIEPDFNCLVFFRNPGPDIAFEARMVHIDTSAAGCAAQHLHTRTEGVPLDVSRTVQPGTASGAPAYPPVSRWDWDSETMEQFIGIRCGDAWCEVHRPRSGEFASSPHYSNPSSMTPPVFAVKGWYDEQRLAAATNGLTPVVSTITGTLIPDPDLGRINGAVNTTPFFNHWQHVAWVALDGPPGKYAGRFNLVQSSVTELRNSVFLCFGETDPVAKTNPCFPAMPLPPCASKPGNEGNQWWARIGRSASPATTKPYCLTRRGHPGMMIPGVVRWRWEIDDDTMWIRCLDGCCEVQGDG